MLVKLNQNKRDTRTIDEIMADRAKMRQGKVLDGAFAKEFNDWFGKVKKDAPKKTSVPATSTSTSSQPACCGCERFCLATLFPLCVCETHPEIYACFQTQC